MASRPQQGSRAAGSSSGSAGPLSASALDRSKSRSRSLGSETSHTASPLHADLTPSSMAGPSTLSASQGRTGASTTSAKIDKGKGALHTIAPGSSQASGVGAQTQAKAKRKRDGEGKRKKVAKACLVCQKSHLTCDEKRPCTRCEKKGIADQCVEGVRKKAKYLMEGEMEDMSDQQYSQPLPSASITSISPTASIAVQPPEQPSFTLPISSPSPPPSLPALIHRSHSGHSGPLSTLSAPTLPTMGMEDDIWLAPNLMGDSLRAVSPDTDVLQSTRTEARGLDDDIGGGLGGGEGLWGDTSLFGNGGFDFGTSASNEYQMLDAMLNSMSPVFPFEGLPADNSFSLDQSTNFSIHQQPQRDLYLSDQLQSSSEVPMISGIRPQNQNFAQSYNQNTRQQSLISPNWPITGNGDATLHPDVNVSPGHPSPWTNWNNNPSAGSQSAFDQPVDLNRDQSGGSGSGLGGIKRTESNSWADGNAFAAAGSSSQNGTNTGKATGRMKTGAEVYHSVVKPFDYTEGYHKLMEHISRNFQQKEVLRVVKALAAFRPSLIALQMPMSEEDEIFLERSFQRTLIELEKLISYSATPTAVWRRTGEIVYANPEFSGLIGKQQDELQSGHTYVYQLFAKQAAILYWENFSLHAFENTTQNFFQAVTLEVGDISLACSCCFTIRRDVFDLPSVIIGQFLPMPTD